MYSFHNPTLQHQAWENQRSNSVLAGAWCLPHFTAIHPQFLLYHPLTHSLVYTPDPHVLLPYPTLQHQARENQRSSSVLAGVLCLPHFTAVPTVPPTTPWTRARTTGEPVTQQCRKSEVKTGLATAATPLVDFPNLLRILSMLIVVDQPG